MSVRSRLERAEASARGEIIPGQPEPIVAVAQPIEEQDPSMPGVPTVAAPTTALAPVPPVPPVAVEPVVVPVVPPVSEEKRYEYQPTDEQGRPMGGIQVVVYRTPDELAEKLANNSTLLLRQLRKERREKALGHSEDRVDDAEKFQNVVEFKPRDLSADERFRISQGIANPETFATSRDELLESAFGAKPAVVASMLNELNRANIRAAAVENYIEFVQTTGFFDSPENRTLVTGWLGTRNLAPTVANFAIAQNRLKEAGLLQEAPVVHQDTIVPIPAVAAVVPVALEPNPQVPATTSPALVTQEPQAKRQSHVPSGLNASNASPTGSLPVVGVSLTLADIDKMSSEEYKRRIRTEPQFVQLVNQLEADALKRRRERTNG
jgi:hypothetical protein